MNTDDVATMRSDIYKKMTPLQKLDVVDTLYEVAWELKKSFIRQKYPDWTEEKVEATVRKIFLYAST